MKIPPRLIPLVCCLLPLLHAEDKPCKPIPEYPPIKIINSPENLFFSKEISFHGILIKASSNVEDAALLRAYDRIAMETENIPTVVQNLASSGAELHIIGRDENVTDLPEWRFDKHVPLYEVSYDGKTRDQRTRGMGGLITSCGEENLLNLPKDRYHGSDICLHEFAHNIELEGVQEEIRVMFEKQYEISKNKGLWINSYAGSNSLEYFAELTMWYFNSHGSYKGFKGAVPDVGKEGLRKYDPEAFELFDRFYKGKIKITPISGVRHPAPCTEVGGNNSPAGKVVAALNTYRVRETKIATLCNDAGITKTGEAGKAGWIIALRKPSSLSSDMAAKEVELNDAKFAASVKVGFHNATYEDVYIADLDFYDGVLVDFKWNI